MESYKVLCSAAASLLLLASGSVAATGEQSLDQSKHTQRARETANGTMHATRDSHGFGTVSAEATTSPKGFVSQMSAGDLYEVEAGRIALKRSQNRRVSEFARQMISAHTRTSARLRSALDAPPIAVRLDGRHQRMIDELRGAKQSDFDGLYLSQQVDAHSEALTLLRRYIRTGSIRAVKHFAEETIPVVRMHFALAQQLLSEHDRRS
jgi:putative membrane protein